MTGQSVSACCDSLGGEHFSKYVRKGEERQIANSDLLQQSFLSLNLDSCFRKASISQLTCGIYTHQYFYMFIIIVFSHLLCIYKTHQPFFLFIAKYIFIFVPQLCWLFDLAVLGLLKHNPHFIDAQGNGIEHCAVPLTNSIAESSQPLSQTSVAECRKSHIYVYIDVYVSLGSRKTPDVRSFYLRNGDIED